MSLCFTVKVFLVQPIHPCTDLCSQALQLQSLESAVQVVQLLPNDYRHNVQSQDILAHHSAGSLFVATTKSFLPSFC